MLSAAAAAAFRLGLYGQTSDGPGRAQATVEPGRAAGRTDRDRAGLATTRRRRANRLHQRRPVGAGGVGCRRRRGGVDRRAPDRGSRTPRARLVGFPAGPDHDVGRRECRRRPDRGVGLAVAGHRCGGGRRGGPLARRGRRTSRVSSGPTTCGRGRQAGRNSRRGRKAGSGNRLGAQRNSGRQRRSTVPGPLRCSTSECPHPIATSWSAALLRELGGRIVAWRAARGADWQLAADYRARSLTIGTRVRAELPGGKEVVGTASAVDDQGRLCRWETGAETVVVSAGDVVHLR